MGRASTLAMIDAADGLGLGRRGVLEWHILHNHYPPMPHSVVDIAERALELAADEEWSTVINFSDFDEKFGDRSMAVAEIISKLHLEEFLTEEW